MSEYTITYRVRDAFARAENAHEAAVASSAPILNLLPVRRVLIPAGRDTSPGESRIECEERKRGVGP